MKCPSCGSEMKSGTVFLRATLFGFLLRGFSHQPVWFSAGDNIFDERIVLKKHFLPGGDTKNAHRCYECGIVVFQGE